MIAHLFLRSRAHLLVAIWLLAIASSAPLLAQPASGQFTYPRPNDAVVALVAAARSGEPDQLLVMLGPDSKDLVSSGDAVADKQSLQNFVKMYAQKHLIISDAPGYKTLVVGKEDWPLPIPIVRDGTVWYFDSARGREEILNRRIGKNELGAIAVCTGYVRAQKEYAAKGHDGLPAGLYAQKIVSDPDKENGLYWPEGPGHTQSPLGPAVATAAAEGYSGGSSPQPYHGYLYKLLVAQGPDANGGEKSYLVDGKQSDGFAMVAYPASYGAGGIMTFIVNQDGVVYQKDLGDDTGTVAPEILTFNPDQSWTVVE